jgi:hypothetical protein
MKLLVLAFKNWGRSNLVVAADISKTLVSSSGTSSIYVIVMTWASECEERILQAMGNGIVSKK